MILSKLQTGLEVDKLYQVLMGCSSNKPHIAVKHTRRLSMSQVWQSHVWLHALCMAESRSRQIACASIGRVLQTEPLRIWGLPTVGTLPAGGAAPAACLKVLQMCKNAVDSPLGSFSRQGRRAQVPGDLRGLSNPAYRQVMCPEDGNEGKGHTC